MSAWFGIFAPKDTGLEIVRLLNAKLQAVIEEPKARERLLEVAPSRSAARRRRLPSACAPTIGCGDSSSRNRDQAGVASMTGSVLKTKFISHGTLGSKDLEATRRFYEEFLGLEVVRTSPCRS